MKDVQIYKNDLFEVGVKLDNGDIVFDAETVARCLGFERIQIKSGKEYKTIRWDRINGYLNRKKDNLVKRGDKITKNEVKQLIQNTRCVVPRYLLQAVGITQESIVVSKECETLNIISESIKDIVEFKMQYYIDGYKIDLYIPKYKLAVECDEFAHYDRDTNYEDVREKYIKEKLNCEFIRYNPDKENFNIGVVINKILMKIINKKEGK